MMTPRAVLVLDAGGPGSMATIQLLKQSALPMKIVAADMSPDCPAQMFADEFVVVPPARDEGYLAAVSGIVAKFNIDVILPSFHFGYEVLRALDQKLFVVSMDTALFCQDKFAFGEWLSTHGHLTPETRRLGDVESIDGKLYIKPRRGAGGKDNYVVEAQSQLDAVKTLVGGSEFVVQNFVQGQHWSVEALRYHGRLVSCVALKVLVHKAGNTVTAEVCENEELTSLCEVLLAELDYDGPANLDFIQSARGYELLELNPRFGSTVQLVGVAGPNIVAYQVTSDEKWLAPIIPGRYTTVTDVVALPKR
jgi:carbamoyl-phosphate synthase large subunit